MTLEQLLELLPQLNLLGEMIAETNKHVISNNQAQTETAETAPKVSARLTLKLGKQTSEQMQVSEPMQAQAKPGEQSEGEPDSRFRAGGGEIR